MNARRLLILTVLLAWAECGFAQVFPGAYTGKIVEDRAVRLLAGSVSVRLMFYGPEVVRVDFLPGPSSTPDSSYAVIRDSTAVVPFSISENDTALWISSSALTVRCGKDPLRLSFLDAAGGSLLAEPASGGMGTLAGRRLARFTVGSGDHFYGTGERGTAMDRRGQSFPVYNTQVYGYGGPVSAMGVNIPFLASSAGYALLFDNTWPGFFDIAASDPSLLAYTAEGGELTFYLIAARGIPAQLERYTWLTGRQPLPPRWSLGFIQSRFGYRNEAEARGVVQTMRQKRIPCDALVLDLYWYGHMGDLAWDLAAWPQPAQMTSDLLAQGIRTVLITQTYMEQNAANFWPAITGGHAALNGSFQPYRLEQWWSCNCDAVLLDLTRPATREWFRNLHNPLFGGNIGGIWTDLGEPERHPDDMVHHAGPARKIHNVYNLLWAKTVQEGFQQARPGERLFNLTRAGWAGIQRYGVIPWSGDVQRSFGGLAVQVPMLLGMGMSGLGYHNSDIGGFCCGTATPELYARWMQFGAFSPVARAHGTGAPTEPWGFGPQVEEISRQFIGLRYRLLPYLYTLARENHETGMPLARPLFLAGGAGLENEGSSFLLGDALLVSPVVEAGQTSRQTALPPGRWVDFWTEEQYTGGQTVTVAAPLERMPLFVRAGSIIPFGPLMQHSGERPLDTLTLAVWPATTGTFAFTLYEDDGISQAYLAGAYARTRFAGTVTDSGGVPVLVLEIGNSAGTFAGRLSRRVYLSEVHLVTAAPTSVERDGTPVPRRNSLEELRQNGDGFYYDPALLRLFIHTPGSTDSAASLVVRAFQLGGLSVGTGAVLLPPRLSRSYPNPFNAAVSFELRIPARERVGLFVYDLLGRRVATLLDEVLPPGTLTVRWDAGNLPSGVYFCRLEAGTWRETGKVLLVR
ncbi:MAG: TIM-barrel domain-containing protein [Bacteroidota bacterium]